MNPIKLLKLLKTKPESFWIKRGETSALKLFHNMAKRVPAYQDFLKKHKIDVTKIKTITDFSNLPLVDKNNYLRKYPLEKLCWDGQLAEGQYVFSTTSGSTGEPFYFPRSDDQDWQYATTAEIYLRTNFQIDKKSTLYIDGFAMGPWIGGLFTYQAIKHLTKRGNYQLSIITTGSVKEEIIKAVKNIGQKYDQILIGGYPPFIKDVIDFGIEQGLNWKKYNLGFIFSADLFSETFRDYVINKTGLKDPYKSTLNHYGLVDLGTVAHETALCILTRRKALLSKGLNNNLFSDYFRQPTFAQYLPEMFFLEEKDNKLICSASSGIPLLRYDMKDIGGLIKLSDLKQQFLQAGLDLDQEIKKANIADTVWNLPFVFVHERSDFIVKLCGANIYPETIRRALSEQSLLSSLTGKFTLIAKFDQNQDQYLEINIELKSKIKKKDNLKKIVTDKIVQFLLRENSEYQYLYAHIPLHQVTPKVILWEYNAKEHFRSGGKQKWVKTP